MAALTAAQVAVIGSDGTTEKSLHLRVQGVTAGDTLDVGDAAAILPAGSRLRKVRTATGVVPVGSAAVGAWTIAGTVLTAPAGPSTDDGWLFVSGEAV